MNEPTISANADKYLTTIRQVATVVHAMLDDDFARAAELQRGLTDRQLFCGLLGLAQEAEVAEPGILDRACAHPNDPPPPPPSSLAEPGLAAYLARLHLAGADDEVGRVLKTVDHRALVDDLLRLLIVVAEGAWGGREAVDARLARMVPRDFTAPGRRSRA